MSEKDVQALKLQVLGVAFHESDSDGGKNKSGRLTTGS
jgi:hypothetical protein